MFWQFCSFIKAQIKCASELSDHFLALQLSTGIAYASLQLSCLLCSNFVVLGCRRHGGCPQHSKIWESATSSTLPLLDLGDKESVWQLAFRPMLVNKICPLSRFHTPCCCCLWVSSSHTTLCSLPGASQN